MAKKVPNYYVNKMISLLLHLNNIHSKTYKPYHIHDG